MAKVKTPLLSTAAAGQLGGLLFRAGTYGPIVSRRSITPALMTPAQCAQRGRLKLAHSAWELLTDANRAAWDAFATYPETGRNAYIRAWTILNKCNKTPTNTPSKTEAITSVHLTYAIFDPTDPSILRIAWTWSGEPNNLLLFYVYPTWSGRDYVKPSKLTFNSYLQAWYDEWVTQLTHRAPSCWLRIDTVSYPTASPQGSILHKITAT